MSNIFPINGIVNFNKRPVIYCFFHFDFSTPLGYNTASLTGLRTICKTRYRKEDLEVTTMKKLYAVLLAMVMVLSLARLQPERRQQRRQRRRGREPEC